MELFSFFVVIIYLSKLQLAFADDTDTASTIHLTDDKEVEIWSPTTSQSIIVEVDPGYQIQVNVTVCDIDGASGDYAVIKAETLNDTGLLFSYMLDFKKSYLYKTGKVSASYTASSSSSTFTAIFTRVGEALTTVTTEEPTSTIILPTPSVNDSDSITVYLYGKDINIFNANDIKNLRNSIAEMSEAYCSDENFPLNGSVSSENVDIRAIYQCPLSWKNFESCVYVNFAVPVNLLEGAESPWTGYQLNTKHLTIMWNRMGSKYMSSIGFSLYPVPNIDNILMWRLTVLCLVIVVFIICLLLIRYLSTRFRRQRRRKLSDTVSIVSSNDRYSQLSLPPHYLQETPPLFENTFSYPYHTEKSTFSEPAFSGFTNRDELEIEETDEEPKLRIKEILLEGENEAEIESET